MSQATERYQQIDSLRALAAAMVVGQHVAESYSDYLPAVGAQHSLLDSVPHYLHLGHISVVGLFMISGFVITSSLRGPRLEGLRKFWIRRLCRLYPAYWLSLIAAYLAMWKLAGLSLSYETLLANVALVQRPLGYTSIQGLYWTLAVELYFYGLCSLWFVLGVLRKPPFLALASLLGVVAAPLTIPYFLGVMHYGALFRHAYDQPENSGLRRLAGGVALALLVRPALYLMDGSPERFGAGFATFWVIPLFCLGTLYFPRHWKRLASLGAATYSIYLFHPPLFFAGLHLLWRPEVSPFWRSLPLGCYILFYLALSAWVGMLIYRKVEEPAMRWAHRWTRK